MRSPRRPESYGTAINWTRLISFAAMIAYAASVMNQPNDCAFDRLWRGRADRRAFLIGGLALLGASTLRAQARPRWATSPFTLGVASGDPASDGVVLWTRLAPDPIAGGGMSPEPVTVIWEVAEDEGMRRVVRSGRATATAQGAHSVHVEVDDLEPNRVYWYRFHAGEATSPIGRTKTLP